MIGPEVHLSLPPASWFTFKPTGNPQALPPPAPASDEFTFKSPFAISPFIYHRLLEPDLPFRFAACYVIAIVTLNTINTKRNGAAWGISKSSVFKSFVLLHNFLLATYSFVTCVAMVRAVSASWPGWLGEHGLPGAVDALCKINGPRGYGDAITYNSSTSTWASKNLNILLGDDQLNPDSTDVGRIWNEGLAFWGWLFYLSKYYEVVDNLIIIAKGKRASTLQVYHHAGALICMWAGIRYMSPPIWMFVLVNSGIHALMYSYYTLCTIGIRPSKAIKQTITTLQIAQFVVGISFAAAHLFISYSVPVSIPYTVKSIISGLPSAAAITSNIKSALNNVRTSATAPSMSDIQSVASDAQSYASSASSFLSGGASTWSSFAAKATDSGASMAGSLASKATRSGASWAKSMEARATDSAASLAHKAADEASTLAVQASATISALASKALADDAMWLKKLLYRAAGREALAEAVRNHQGELFGPEFDDNLIPRTIEEFKEEVLYRHEHQTVRCLDTEGQAFAILLNVAYLFPLILLFLRFFARSYSGKKRTLSDSAQIASKKMDRAMNKFGRKVEGEVASIREEAVELGEDLHVVENYERVKKQVKKKAKSVQKQYQAFDAEAAMERVKHEAGEAFERVKAEAGEVYEKVVEGATHVRDNVVEAMNGADAGDVVEEEQQQQHADGHGDDIKDDVEGSEEEDEDEEDEDLDVSEVVLSHSPDRGFGIFPPKDTEADVIKGLKTEGGDETKKAVVVETKEGPSGGGGSGGGGKLTLSHSSNIPVKKQSSHSHSMSSSNSVSNSMTSSMTSSSASNTPVNYAQAAAHAAQAGNKSPTKSPKKKGNK